MRYTRKVRLGVVCVDSGEIVVGDPCYITEERVPPRGKEQRADFWGRDQEKLCEVLKKRHGIAPTRTGSGSYRVSIPGKTAEQAASFLRNEARRLGLLVLAMPRTGSGRDIMFDTCTNKDQGGQLLFEDGQPGLGVCFSSGLGDGTYEVWAYYQQVPGWGERIAKVVIRLL